MLGKIFDRILHEDEDEIKKEPEKKKEKSARPPRDKKEITLVIIAVLVGFAYRFYFLYFISGTQNAGVGWYGDTYHHWQIAYLTNTTGLKEGFLRLWDLKGMEYFWGPLHPLLLTALFKITGSIDIVLTRLVSIGFGMGSVYLLYSLARRYWGKTVGLAALLFGALFPIAVFNDASGMLEPIGVFFLLLGVYLWRRHPIISGVSWALAAMARAEAWIFSLVLIAGLVISGKRSSGKAKVVLAWLVVMILYMKYLLDHTGNPIYPVWWNYLANAKGAWVGGPAPELTELQIFIRPFLIATAVVSFAALVWAVYRRTKTILLLLLGWLNIFFVSSFMGLTHYLTGWEWWFPVIRFFVFPYLFLATMVLALFKSEGKSHKLPWNILVWVVALVLIIFTQLTWLPIWKHFKTTVPLWENTKSWGQTVGDHYEEGTLLFPEHDPHFTYATVKVGEVKGENILGQMFDPYYYFDDRPYDNWGENREIILSWLKNNDVRLTVVRKDAERYQELFERESGLFEKIDTLEGGVYEVWKVFPERIELEDEV